jgi:hypothetical protein
LAAPEIKTNLAASNSRVMRFSPVKRRNTMINASQIQEHAEIIGSDGIHVGTVDRVEGGRIK